MMKSHVIPIIAVTHFGDEAMKDAFRQGGCEPFQADLGAHSIETIKTILAMRGRVEN